MTADTAVGDTRSPTGRPIGRGLTAGAVTAVTASGFVAACGPAAVIVLSAVALVIVVAWRPVFAIYFYLATLPFIAGFERGTLIPGVRLNEALLVVLVAGALAGGYIRGVRGVRFQPRAGPLDVPLAGFAVAAVLWPLASMLVRGVDPGRDDVAAVLPVVKLAALYVLVRVTVRVGTQVVWCIRLMVASATGVAAIAVLQTLGFEPILRILRAIDPTASYVVDRGATTLMNPIASGDYILIGLVLLVTSSSRNLFRPWIRTGAGFVLTAGVFAAGQFSTWLAALVVAALLFWRTPAARRSALRLLPLLCVAALVGAPAVIRRVLDFSAGSLPVSWQVRFDNLAHLYLPTLIGRGGFLIGVSPDSVVVPPDTVRDTVYMESGYLQLLWIGGLPLFIAFVALSYALLRNSSRLASRADGVGACASALFVVWGMVIVLMVLDAHLYMRGVGDLIFVLFGIVGGCHAREGTDDDDR